MLKTIKMIANNTNIRCTNPMAICMIFLLGCTASIFAQKGRSNQAHVGFIYPLSTNGKTAPLDTNNFSLHVIAGVSRQENGFLIAGISGVVKGNAYGTMVSGIFNHIGNDAKGVQVAGVLNQIRHNAHGVQIAGLANITGDAKGLQIAGLINKAADANVQIAGLVNVAKKVKGVQLAGLLNIAEESDYPIGVLNIIKDGEIQLGVSVDEGGSTVMALRSGGKVLYGILGLGYHFKYEEARYMLEGGIGAHVVSAGAFRLNAELASTAMTRFEGNVYGRQSLRAFAGYRITPGMELFAGPTFNHLSFDRDEADIRDGRYLWEWHGDDLFNGFYIGGMVGLQFSL